MGKKSSRLSKEDFETLDDLIGKHDFGGYYDLVECLKTVLSRIERGKLKENWEEQIKTLPDVVNLLLLVSGQKNG